MTFAAIKDDKPNIRLILNKANESNHASHTGALRGFRLPQIKQVHYLLVTILFTLLLPLIYLKLEIKAYATQLRQTSSTTKLLQQRLNSVLSAVEGLSEVSKSQTSLIGKSLSDPKADNLFDNKNNNNLQVVTVSVPKANLRLGPGTEHGILMALSEGVRLLVEQSEGSWLRVIAPSGERAWVSQTVVVKE